MAAPVTDTPSEPDSSTVSFGCAAHSLDGEHRQQLAVEVLARTQPVTELAKRHGVSRKFVYHQADKGAQALEQAFQSPPSNDEQVLFYLPVTRAWLRQVVLGLVLLCHSPFRGVIAFFRDLHERFFPLQQALDDLRNRFHRASSLVENFNSRLRNYFFLRRRIGPAYLDLPRFFLNHQPFARSEKPQRQGKSPAELLTGQSHPHWLEMLGSTRFRRVSATV